jgi:hypothetical protein
VKSRRLWGPSPEGLGRSNGDPRYAAFHACMPTPLHPDKPIDLKGVSVYPRLPEPAVKRSTSLRTQYNKLERCVMATLDVLDDLEDDLAGLRPEDLGRECVIRLEKRSLRRILSKLHEKMDHWRDLMENSVETNEE